MRMETTRLSGSDVRCGRREHRAVDTREADVVIGELVGSKLLFDFMPALRTAIQVYVNTSIGWSSHLIAFSVDGLACIPRYRDSGGKSGNEQSRNDFQSGMGARL